MRAECGHTHKPLWHNMIGKHVEASPPSVRVETTRVGVSDEHRLGLPGPETEKWDGERQRPGLGGLFPLLPCRPARPPEDPPFPDGSTSRKGRERPRSSES